VMVVERAAGLIDTPATRSRDGELMCRLDERRTILPWGEIICFTRLYRRRPSREVRKGETLDGIGRCQREIRGPFACSCLSISLTRLMHVLRQRLVPIRRSPCRRASPRAGWGKMCGKRYGRRRHQIGIFCSCPVIGLCSTSFRPPQS
jgi:hypothetical protein